MEEDVNTFFLPLLEKAQRDAAEAKKGFHFDVLTLQIQHLMSSLDVLVDAWNFDQGNQSGDRRDFQRDKMFLHAVKWDSYTFLTKLGFAVMAFAV